LLRIRNFAQTVGTYAPAVNQNAATSEGARANRWVRLAVGVLGTAAAVLVMVWPFATGRWKGPLDDLGSNGRSTATSPAAQPEVSVTTIPEATITVAAGGRFGGEVLQSLEFAFFEETGESADVVSLSTDFEVWKQATQTNRVDADVIEVGFRSDAFSGEAAAFFLPLDEELVPGMAGIPPRFRLPDDRGLVVGFSGLLGFVVNELEAVSPPRSWSDVATLDPARLVVPAPSSVTAPILVLALGNGDVGRGLEVYASWIEAGAQTASGVEDYVAALRGGAEVAVWTSSGLWRAEGRMQGLVFAAPEEGAVALPAFSGILASSENPEVAARWLEYRLSSAVQSQVMSLNEHGRFGQDDIAPLSPVVGGVDVGTSNSALFGLDTFPGSVIAVDWLSYTPAREALRERFEEASG
jgi:ABC-type Fe3+ transport system substrate-binding protein